MNGNKTMQFVKGMGAGMVAGAAVAMVAKTVMTDSHKITKGSAKAFRALGDFVDGVKTMVK